ncbi:uncharacterized protein LOC135105984 [Scylla paramamosain]|uniref:uncharacterized protein LOC135105984 n=1 Tax=Scylla paramamosain TaxID=85552 RepID=UPI00308398D7
MTWRKMRLDLEVVLFCCLALCRTAAACPVEHECKGFGLEDLGTGTGEAAFCSGPQSTPYCPGVYVNGTVLRLSPRQAFRSSLARSYSPISTKSSLATSSSPTTTKSSTATSSSPISTKSSTATSSSPATTKSSTATSSSPTTTKLSTATSSSPATTKSSTATSSSPTTTKLSTATSSSPTTTKSSTATSSSPITTASSPATSSSSTTTKSSPASTSAPCDPASCIDKTEGIYVHPDCDCRRYYTCIKSVKDETKLIQTNYRCTGKYVFDPDKLRCTEDSSVCPTL